MSPSNSCLRNWSLKFAQYSVITPLIDFFTGDFKELKLDGGPSCQFLNMILTIWSFLMFMFKKNKNESKDENQSLV